MDLAILSAFIETTIPAGVRFNEHNVALNGLRHSFSFRRLNVIFDTCCLNGFWGGRTDIIAGTWGSCGPISRECDFIYRSFEECVDSLWNYALERIESNKEGISMEFLHFKVAYKKWFTLTAEQKYALFKEVDFYAW